MSIEEKTEDQELPTNPDGEEPEVEEETTDEGGSPEELTSLKASLKEAEEKNTRLFARLKKAEDKKRKEIEKSAPPTSIELEVEKIVEVTSALEGLDVKEKARLIIESKQKGTSLGETRRDEDFVLWQTAYKEKVAKNNAPLPSTKQTTKGQEPTLDEVLKDGTLEEKEKALKELGTITNYGKPTIPIR